MSWDERFLNLAYHIAQWSKDPSTQVGCVIADGKYIRAVGFNGFPATMEDNDRLSSEGKHDWIIHAEENAILSAQGSLKGCTAYIWPLNPCTRCAAKLIQVGVSRVVANTPSNHHAHKYQLDKVKDVFAECNVNFELVEF